MSNTQTTSTAAPVAKYILKIKDGDNLKDVGKVVEREGKNGSVYMTVEGTDLIVGSTQEGNLVLKKKATDPNAEYKYEIIGRLFENTSKAGNTWFRAKTKEGVIYMMFLNTPKTGGGKKFGGSRPGASGAPANRSGGFQRRA